MDPYTKDIIEVSAWIAIALGFGGSIVALVYNIKATNQERHALNLQRDALRTNIYLQTTGRINELVEKSPTATEDQKIDRANLMLLGAFENFAFYDNQGYFTTAMTNQYLGTIYKITEDMKKAGLLKGTSADKENAFVELRKFCLKHIGKDPLKSNAADDRTR